MIQKFWDLSLIGKLSPNYLKFVGPFIPNESPVSYMSIHSQKTFGLKWNVKLCRTVGYPWEKEQFYNKKGNPIRWVKEHFDFGNEDSFEKGKGFEIAGPPSYNVLRRSRPIKQYYCHLFDENGLCFSIETASGNAYKENKNIFKRSNFDFIWCDYQYRINGLNNIDFYDGTPKTIRTWNKYFMVSEADEFNSEYEFMYENNNLSELKSDEQSWHSYNYDQGNNLASVIVNAHGLSSKNVFSFEYDSQLISKVKQKEFRNQNSEHFEETNREYEVSATTKNEILSIYETIKTERNEEKYVYRYNQHGDLDLITEDTGRESRELVLSNRYTYDANGNWVTCIRYLDGFYYKFEREIEYY